MTFEEIKTKLKEIGGKNDSFSFREADMKALVEILQSGESIQHAISGKYKDKMGIAVCTNSRVIFLFKAVLGAMFMQDFSLKAISSVELQSAFTGSVKVIASGTSAEIVHTNKNQAIAFAGWVRSAVDANKITV